MSAPGRDTFGQLLRRYRLAAGYSQERLAALSRLGVHTIADLERGVSLFPHAHSVESLADALHLTGSIRASFASAARRPGASSPQDQEPTPTAGAPTFVGRASELATGMRFLAGEGPAVLLFGGEPGIGKSRLLGELAAQARGSGWRVVAGGCDQRSGREPYAPFVETLDESLLATSPSRRKGDLKDCDWLARLGPELADKIKTPVPEWLLTPEQERRMIFAAARHYLTNIAGPVGTLLILDDLQWASPDALNLLAYLIRTRAIESPTDSSTRAALRVLGAYRTSDIQSGHPLENLIVDLARDERVSLYELGRLSEGEARSLVTGLVEVAPDAEQWATDVMARADGVPFYLVNFAQEYRPGAEAAPLADDSGALIGGPKIPWLVSATIRRRLSALPPEAQETLALAAIIGRVAPLELLRLALRSIGDDLASALEAACRARLLEETGAGSVAYRFTHDLIRETVVASLSKARQALLHRMVANALERLPAPERERQVVALADHLTQAGERTRALPYALQAGVQAERSYAYSEAEQRYRAAHQAAQDLGDQAREAEALEGLSRVQLTLARNSEALATLDAALCVYQALGDVEGQARVAEGAVQAYIALASFDVGIARLGAMIEDLRVRGLSRLGQARLYSALAQLLERGAFYDAGEKAASRLSGTLAAAERAMTLARVAGDEGIRAQAMLAQGLALGWLGRYEESLDVTEGALPLAEAAGDIRLLSRGLKEAQTRRELYGDFALSQRHIDRALALSERAGAPVLAAHMWFNQAELAYYQGDWALARAAAERSLEIAQTYDLEASTLAAQRYLAHLSVAAGEQERADALLAAPLAVAVERQDLQSLRMAYALLAERDLLAGRAEAVCSYLEPLLDRPGLEEDQVLLVLPQYAWALLARGDEQDAELRAAQSCKRARARHHHTWLVDGLWVLAMVRIRQAHWEDACALLEEAITQCRTMPYPYAEAKSLYVYGQLHAARGEPKQACEQYRAALLICDRLSEGLYCKYIEHALAELDHAPPHG